MMETPTGEPWIDNAYTIWVCMCCMLTHANGECCTEYAPMHDDGTPCFEGVWCYRSHATTVDGSAPLLHGGDGIEPLSAIAPEDGLAMGMGHAEHTEDCEVRKQGTHSIDDYECDCERNEYTQSQCEGCGSYLHGERHAMTVFPGEHVK